MSENTVTFGQLAMSAVNEMANIGLGHATTSLSELTGRTIHMSIPNVDSVPVKTVVDLIGGPEETVVGVYMPFEGEVDGHIAFLFPWRSAQRLWEALMGMAPADAASLDEIQASAMLEVGNILNSSFLNALSDMTDLAMHATPPLVSVEMAASVVESIVVEAELSQALALAIETEIHDEEGSLSGYFLCIPNLTGLRTLFARLGIQEAA